MYPLHTEFGISRQILGWERKKCEGGVRSPAELTLSSNPNHGQLMLKFYKKKYSVMLYIFHKNALLTSNFNENFLGAINAPFPPIYFVWKVDTAHFSAFRCVYYDVSNIWPKPRPPTPRVLVDIHCIVVSLPANYFLPFWKVEHLSYTYIQEKRCNHSEDFRLRCLTFTSIYSREMKSSGLALGLALLLSSDFPFYEKIRLRK